MIQCLTFEIGASWVWFPSPDLTSVLSSWDKYAQQLRTSAQVSPWIQDRFSTGSLDQFKFCPSNKFTILNYENVINNQLVWRWNLYHTTLLTLIRTVCWLRQADGSTGSSGRSVHLPGGVRLNPSCCVCCMKIPFFPSHCW